MQRGRWDDEKDAKVYSVVNHDSWMNLGRFVNSVPKFVALIKDECIIICFKSTQIAIRILWINRNSVDSQENKFGINRLHLGPNARFRVVSEYSL